MMATGGNGGHIQEVDIFGQCEEILSNKSSSTTDRAFDEVIGHIQDIIIGDDFRETQETFMDKHYRQFEETDENKFIYTDIHKEYIEVIEDLIKKQLITRMPQFDMEQFMTSLPERRDQVPEEIYDMLTSFIDFLTFKQMCLDYKADKEGGGISLEGLLISSSTNR